MSENKPVTFDVAHVTLAVLFIGLLIVSTFWIVRPFLTATVWAFFIVVSTWPAFLRFEAFLGGRRGLAVTVMTLLILFIVLIPLTGAVIAIVGNVEDISARFRGLVSSIPLAPPQWLEKIPVAGSRLIPKWQEIAALTPDERAAMVAPYAKTALLWFVAQAGSLGMTLLQFLLTTIITAIMYANGESIQSGMVSFARRLAGQNGENVTFLAGKAIRGVAMGVVLTAILQAAVGGIGLVAAGVPGAAFLTALMFMFCLAQIGGGIVLVPVVIWLYWKGDVLMGTILLVFTVIALTMDNFIRPILIKKGADLPLLLVFAGVIGGLIAFGIIGLFIGPVVLAVSYTLLRSWVTGAVDNEGEALADEKGAP